MAIFVGRRGLYRHRKKYIGYQPYGQSNTWHKRYGRKFYLKGRLSECKKGNHHFVACDDWESTCLHCGKFQS